MTQYQQITDTAKANATTLFGYVDQAFQSYEQLLALNLQACKTSMAEAQEAASAMLSAKSPNEVVELQTQLLQAAPQKAVAYGRKVSDIITAAGAEQRAAVEAKMGEAQAKFLDVVNGAMKQAPGSENAAAFVKSAVAFANNAYENVSKVSKQVTEAVDANVVQFTESTAKPARAVRAKSEA